MSLFVTVVCEDNDAEDSHMTTEESKTETSQHLPKPEEEKVRFFTPEKNSITLTTG